jgi:hypothetical protein
LQTNLNLNFLHSGLDFNQLEQEDLVETDLILIKIKIKTWTQEESDLIIDLKNSLLGMLQDQVSWKLMNSLVVIQTVTHKSYIQAITQQGLQPPTY